jgi:predicted Zn-dependent peptidase
MVLGDCNPEPVYEGFCKSFQALNRQSAADCRTEVVRTVEKVKDVTEKQDIAQSKLVLGFRAGTAVPDENVAAAKLLSALYGGTPHSKLFLNIREKLSLCYYCSSRYDSNKGILYVESGVETQNIEKAKAEILLQLEEIKKGNFDDEELNSAKMSMCNSYRTLGDYLGGLESWYVSQTFQNKIQTPEEAAVAISSVTREQIIEAANKVTLDTVYRLVGSEDEQV